VLWLEVGPTAPIQSAATTREVKFQETGVVARLRAHNRSLRPMLVPGNLVVDGGRQARVIESSIVLPSDVEVQVPVRCVEKRRWSAKHGAPPTDDFEIRGATSSRTCSSFARNKSDCLALKGRYELDQRAVWTHVGEELQRTQVRSSTHSYADFIQGAKTKAARAARETADRAPRNANGLVVAHADGSVWVEVLPTREDLRAAAGLLLADLFDPAGSHASPPRQEPPSAVLERAWREALSPVEVPPCTLGSAFVLRAGAVFGSVLLFEGGIAHLGIGNGP
jgi:hypothetical protein